MSVGLETTVPAELGAERGADRIGRFVVLERLGEGGMGVVYSAYDPELDRKVAIKVLRSADPDAAARMQREARSMARLSDPHVVVVHEVGEDRGRVFIAMELVKGQTLRGWLAEADRGWREILAVFLQAGRGLAAAHAAEIVHRDFKPENVLIDKNQHARVTDFGLARADDDRLDSGATAVVAGAAAYSSALVTEHGAVVGTPAYMAPEQIMGRHVDAHADQFAFCVALWEALFRERPFEGQNMVDLALALTDGRIREPESGSRVPAWLRRVVQRGLAVQRESRWPSMAVLLAELSKGHARARARVVLVAVAMAGLFALGLQAWLVSERASAVAACEREGASIAAVWPGEEESARTGIRDAILATGVSYAPPTLESVQPLLDAYASEWQRVRTDTCLTEQVAGEWDASIGAQASDCLAERRGALEGLVEQLADADEAVVRAAVTGAARLMPIEPCADEVLLERRPDLPDAQRDEVNSIRSALARAGAMERAGRVALSVEAATEALERAIAVEWGPIRAQALVTLGRALKAAGDSRRAEERLVEAYVDAVETDARDVAEEAAISLIFVVGVDLERHSEALLWNRLAEAESHRRQKSRSATFTDAWRINSVAAVHASMGALDEARTRFEEALSIREATLGTEHPDVAQSLNNLAVVHKDRGEFASARALHERILVMRERTLGPSHPDLATTLNNLGGVLLVTGNPADARSLFERALAIQEKALGPRHRDTALTLGNIATSWADAGKYAQAITLHKQALAVRETALGKEHSDVGESLNNLCVAELAAGALTDAQAHCERGLALYEKAFGKKHVKVGAALASLGNLHTKIGHRAAATQAYRRALEIFETIPGGQHYAAAVLVELAQLHVAEQDAAAIPLLERALELREATETQFKLLGDTRFLLGQALWDASVERGRAIKLVERAAEDYRAANENDIEKVGQVTEWLKKHQEGIEEAVVRPRKRKAE